MEKGVQVAESTELGRIAISHEAVAQIVGHVAAESYGIVGMAGRRLPRLRAKRRLTEGIDVRAGDGGGVEIELHVVVEHGLNLAEIASTVRSRVTYEVERQTGLTVASVDVNIEHVRSS